MKIAVIDDYQDAFWNLKCFSKLKDHKIIVYRDTEKDPQKLTQRCRMWRAP